MADYPGTIESPALSPGPADESMGEIEKFLEVDPDPALSLEAPVGVAPDPTAAVSFRLTVTVA